MKQEIKNDFKMLAVQDAAFSEVKKVCTHFVQAAKTSPTTAKWNFVSYLLCHSLKTVRFMHDATVTDDPQAQLELQYKIMACIETLCFIIVLVCGAKVVAKSKASYGREMAVGMVGVVEARMVVSAGNEFNAFFYKVRAVNASPYRSCSNY